MLSRESQASAQHVAQIEQGESNDTALFDAYRSVVRPDRSVVVIGPSASIFSDATTLLVAHLLGQDGNFFIADPVSKNSKSRKEMEEKVGGVVAGIGNVHRYIQEITEAQNCGLKLANPVWLGEESGAQHIIAQDNSLDVVVDHNTSVFLAGLPNLSGGNDFERERVLQDCYEEYSRVLRSGGNVLLQTNDDRHGLMNGIFNGSVVGQTLTEYGFRVIQRKSQKDIVIIPIEKDVALQLKENQFKNNGDNMGYFLGSRVVDRSGKYYLRFDKPDHYCKDFYLATKE